MNSPSKLRPAAHPVVGWVALMRVPTSDQPGSKIHSEDLELPGMIIHVLDLNELSNAQPGLHVGIVIENGPMPMDEMSEVYCPWPQGALVWYTESNGIQIGDYTYISMHSVIAWEDPER